MRRILLAALMGIAAAPAFASTDFNVSCGLNPNCQADFRAVTEDITGGLNYKTLAPAEATGLTGIGVGAYGSYTPVQNKSAWKNLTGSDVNAVGMAGIALHKGLPFNFDVGATYTAVPGTSARLYGFELRYALLAGGIAEPALALRASYTGSSGIDKLKVSTTGVDAVLSKGFAMVTPFVGGGWVRGKADPDASTGLKAETVNKGKFFAGLRFSLLLLEITPEYEHVGRDNSYNLRLGLSF